MTCTLKIYTHLMLTNSQRTRKIITSVYSRGHRNGPFTAHDPPEAA
ncbi:hypothetical protein ACFQV2_33190 [Actinokineospora soli]|uniref:Uncharacterized protein n=1 Tax=Actinokineospora soli TaxID=1048753 RepID=A0ABW2TYM7_9PSEU